MPVRAMAALLAVALLLPVPTNAEPLRLHLGWDGVRAVASHAEISKRVIVRLAPDGRRTLKGRLVEIADAGITLSNPRKKPQNRERLVPRREIHTIRFVPVKGDRFPGHPYRWRLAAVAGAVPVWIGGYFVGVSFGHIREGPLFKTKDAWHGLALAFALPYVLYRLAWKADRGRGAIFIELDHGTQTGSEAK